MRTRRVRVAILMVLLSAGMGVQAQQQSVSKPEITGVWQLASYTRDGERLSMKAMLIITERHFTRVLMEEDRPSFEGFDFRQLEKLTAEQRRIIAEAYPRFNASAGTWRVAGNQFYFTSTVHHNPGAVGRESDRTFELTGDRLRLYAEAGSGVVDEIWQRVERFPGK